jgi:hypothetical protein
LACSRPFFASCSIATQRKRLPALVAPTMPERIKMLAPTPIVHDPPTLLADVRLVLSLRPVLAEFPARLAEHLEADERTVRVCLEALIIEDEVRV